jgi:hypothetical protein
MLDPSDRLAAQIARNGDPEPFEFEETDTTFTISWKGLLILNSEFCPALTLAIFAARE